MIVKRFGYKSEPIDIGDEHITADNKQAHDFYHEYMHYSCQEYIRLRWTINRIEWNRLKENVAEIVDKTPNLYFDGPLWIVSVVPWKEAKYGQWVAVPKKSKMVVEKGIHRWCS